MDARWERTYGGRKPVYHLRKYTFDQNYLGHPIIGMVRLTSPKKKRWEVTAYPLHTQECLILCHLTGVTAEEAMGAAKMMILGVLGNE